MSSYVTVPSAAALPGDIYYTAAVTGLAPAARRGGA